MSRDTNGWDYAMAHPWLSTFTVCFIAWCSSTFLRALLITLLMGFAGGGGGAL